MGGLVCVNAGGGSGACKWQFKVCGTHPPGQCFTKYTVGRRGVKRHAAMFTYISRDTARVVLFMNSKYSTLFPVYKWQKTMCKVIVYKQKSKLTQ